MLTITKDKFAVFSQIAYKQFENDLVSHSREFSPDLCNTIIDDGLRSDVKSAMSNANKYGFSKRGPIRLFVEMTLLFGSFFDTDPQYRWVPEILANTQNKDELSLSWDLYHATTHYLETVQGQDDVNVFNALKRLKAMAGNFETLPTSSFSTDLVERFQYIYPEKALFIGHSAILDLIEASVGHCSDRYGFTSTHAKKLYCALTFAFGHGCDRDLLYPWIAKTLTDELLTPERRAQRLHLKAVTWLDHVLAKE